MSKHGERETVCGHEAAHAVMRRLVGLPMTTITTNARSGYCHGTGRRISARQAILLSLAGTAYESGYGLSKINFEKSQFDDLDKARDLINIDNFLTQSSRGLPDWFQEACEILWPYCGVIEAIGQWLETERTLSGKRITRLLHREGVPRGT